MNQNILKWIKFQERLVIKRITDFKEYSNKQMSKLKMSNQDFDEKFSNLDEKISKETF
jgi:vacuolar-type H+-ATPase subunit H